MNRNKAIIGSAFFAIVILLFSTNSFAQVPLVFDVENRTTTSCNTTAGNTSTSLSSLPNPFEFTNGGMVETFDDWTCRRNQIKSDIETYEIGPKQPKPASVTATYSGGKLNITSTVNGQSLTQSVNVTVPSGSGPFPVVIGMNAGTGSLSSNLFSGCIQINFAHDQVVTYASGSGSINSSDPFFKLYPSTNIGKYSAWSWGISRIIDGLELTQATLNADLTKIAVTGCSYAGKMALFGGAFDERIALTIAQESGGGGINSWRMSQQYTTRTGVNVEKIDNTNYSWFKSSMRNINPNNLPHDHHELVAMIAPRALLVLGNPTQEWLCDESGYKSCVAAAEVWKAMGVEDRIGWVFTPDHNHCSASSDQNTAVTSFVNKFLKGQSVSTNIRTNPTKGTQQNLTINSSVYNWTTPTITFAPANPNAPKVTISAPLADASIEFQSLTSIVANVTDIDNNLTKVEFFNGETKLGEDLTAPYEFSLKNLAVGKYTIIVKATDASSNTGTASISFTIIAPPVKIFKTNTAPIIDGAIDFIWTDNNITAISAENVLVGTVTNVNDLSGTAKFIWDNSYVYVLAEIKDNNKQNDSQNSYDDDAVEIYFDINNDKTTTYGTNDVQLSFGWDDGVVVGSLPSGRSIVGISYAALATSDGYIIEARIPWTTLQASPENNQFIGLDFMINDDDNGGGRDKKLAWNAATDNAWQNPSLFGTSKLVDEIVTYVEDKEEFSVNIYPNPAKDKIYVLGIEGQFDYRILNLFGEELENATSNGTLDLNNLKNGSYLLQIQQKQKTTKTKLVIIE